MPYDATRTVYFKVGTPNPASAAGWGTYTKKLIRPDMTPRCLTSANAWPVCGVCWPGPCTCAYIYRTDAETLAFVRNDGVAAVKYTLPGQSTVQTIAPGTLSIVVGAVEQFNSGNIQGCADRTRNCSLPTVRSYTTVAGNASAAPSHSAVLQWRRWTEPALLSAKALANATASPEPLEMLGVTHDDIDYLYYQHSFTLDAPAEAAEAVIYVGTTYCQSVSVFIDGAFVGSNVDLTRPFQKPVTLVVPASAPLAAEPHTLTVVVASLGINNYPVVGGADQLPQLGIVGDVLLWPGVAGAPNISLTRADQLWHHRSGLTGELTDVAAASPVPAVWANAAPVPSGPADLLPLSWFRTTFAVPAAGLAAAAAGDASILLDAAGLGRGHLWLISEDLGRYYTVAYRDESCKGAKARQTRWCSSFTISRLRCSAPRPQQTCSCSGRSSVRPLSARSAW